MQDNFQSRRTVLRTLGVARGTTLQTAAPSTLARPTNLFMSDSAWPPNHAAVAMFFCFTTLLASASPRWVFVFPTSKRIIIASLFLFSDSFDINNFVFLS